MKHTYTIEGMTCQNCRAHVEKALTEIAEVTSASVNLEQKEAIVTMSQHIDLAKLRAALPGKYTISNSKSLQHSTAHPTPVEPEQSKLAQLRPLFLILGYIATASFLMHRSAGDVSAMMLDFMGLFFIVFSFFKLLDVGGFAASFMMYDPLASKVPVYGKVYPFIESGLGLMFLFRWNVQIALIVTIVVLGLTTYGVTRTLLAKRKIKCACLGTALNLPMTEATFIENAIMILMSIAMLTQLV